MNAGRDRREKQSYRLNRRAELYPGGFRGRRVLDESKVSLVDGAVLGALNIADEYFKEVEASENLRRQLKEYLEEATKMKMELSEAKREIFKLQNKK